MLVSDNQQDLEFKVSFLLPLSLFGLNIFLTALSLRRGLRPGVPAGVRPAERRAAQVVAAHRSPAERQRQGVPQMLWGAAYLMLQTRKQTVLQS